MGLRCLSLITIAFLAFGLNPEQFGEEFSGCCVQWSTLRKSMEFVFETQLLSVYASYCLNLLSEVEPKKKI